jgi:hypothetical protein
MEQIMMEIANPPAPGQFWRDTVNTDILYVSAIEEPDPEPGKIPIPNVRCLSFTGGIAYLGVIDLSLLMFSSGRFEKVPEWKALWYRWKFRKVGAWKI